MSSIGNPVVVGYISTPQGEAALERAIAEAKHRDALVVVIQSQKTRGGLDVVDGVEVDESMDPVRRTLQEAGVRFEVRPVVSGGDVSEDLLTVADEVDADLVVIGLRSRTAVGKLIMGSNAQNILLRATCPVLAVKAP